MFLNNDQFSQSCTMKIDTLQYKFEACCPTVYRSNAVAMSS